MSVEVLRARVWSDPHCNERDGHWMSHFLEAWAPWGNGPGDPSLMGSGGLSLGLCSYRVLGGKQGRVVVRALVPFATQV